MTTSKQLSQSRSLPQRQQHLPNTPLKTPERLYALGVIAGTVFTAISQQVAFTSIPLLGLLLMQRANQQRLTLAHQQQQQTTTVVESCISSTQFQQLQVQIERIESFPQNCLTKTHLTPIIAKLHQLQQENKVFKLKETGALAQQINNLQQQLDALTNQTADIQASQQRLKQQFHQPSSQAQPSCRSKSPLNLIQNHRVAIFVDGANLYHSASQLGLEPPDYADLTFFKGQSSLTQALFYTGIDPANQLQQKFLSKLQRLGYQIVSKEVIKRADGSCKANLDVELALDLVELADTYDTAILFSGDGDFVPAIERVQRLGKQVKVAGYRATTSQKLLELADDYFDLETLTGFQQVA